MNLQRRSIKQCPVCQSTTSSPWLHALGFELQRCASCGHRYAAEVLAAESLSHGYYEEPEEDLASRNSRAKEMRFAEYKQLLGATFEKRGKVLDVGCNTGELLWLFQQEGWDVQGVEVSPGPAAYAAKHLAAPVHCGTFEDFDVEQESFDLVTLTHVLEHMPDPHATLHKLREFTSDKGSLLLEVPNADDAILPLFGGMFRPLCPGDHVSFFDKTSLRRVITESGWKLEGITAPLHARDVVYSALMSGVDFLRTRGGRKLSGSGGVESQTRYRGRFREPLRKGLDAVVEAADPMVVWSQQRWLSWHSGAVLIAHATRA